MANPENQAIQNLHTKLPSFVHREKMSNPYSNGTADVWYAAWPCDLWVEYKFLAKPPQRAVTLDLSDNQRIWLADKYRKGRAVAVVLLFPAKFGGVIYTHLSWGERKIQLPAPDADHIIKRELIAEFIVRSCTCAAFNSSLVYRGEDRSVAVPDRRIFRGDIPHYLEPT